MSAFGLYIYKYIGDKAKIALKWGVVWKLRHHLKQDTFDNRPKCKEYANGQNQSAMINGNKNPGNRVQGLDGYTKIWLITGRVPYKQLWVRNGG